MTSLSKIEVYPASAFIGLAKCSQCYCGDWPDEPGHHACDYGLCSCDCHGLLTKARDLISGWPRPRSTESMARAWSTEFFFGWNTSLLSDPERIVDRERNRVYHLQQQTMEDTYLAGRSYRR